MRLLTCLILALGLSGCGDTLPDLQSDLSPAARGAAWPELVPLAPILAENDAPLLRDPAAEGLTLAARAADLRRRASALRRMDLS
jgi:hypothetical protein